MENRNSGPQGSVSDGVVVVTADPVLALDICDALVTDGLPSPVVLSDAGALPFHAARCAALIVDADALDDAGKATVRDCVRAGRRVVVIADNGEVAARMQGGDGLWFAKPVSADHLAVRICDLIRGGAGTPA